jgi:hypothetical protein
MSDRWTPARISAMMRMWDQGSTSREIAEELGMSRSAVLGKVHRLGLARRKGGRPYFNLPLKSFNCFLTENQINWLRKTYGHKRMAAGLRAMLDEAMQITLVKPVPAPPKVVVPLPPIPKHLDGPIPWPDKQRLMAGR